MRRTQFHPQSKFSKVFFVVFFLMTCLFSVSSLTNAASAEEVTLAWDANSEDNLAGYKLYYKLDTGGAPYDGIGLYEGDSPVAIYLEDLDDPGLPVYTLSGLADGQLYYFVLTAFDADGLESDYSDEVSYEVPAASADHTITASVAGAGGSIVPEGTVNVAEGASQTFSIVADTNYSISDVIVDGVSVGQVSAYSFENVNASHSIEVLFAIDTFTVTATAGTGGAITPAGTTTADFGTSVSYTIAANANYSITDVMVDGVSVGPVSAYTFENISASHTIEAVFGVDVFTLTATAGSGGTISPAGATTVETGASVSYTITPNTNYHIADVVVDGMSVGQVSSYTFGNISASHTIEAVFATDTFTVTATAGSGIGTSNPGGTISPAGVTTAELGTSVSYTITPNTNYHIADVLVDGASVGKVSSYTFQAIDASHTIQAVFAVDTFTVTATAGTGGTISPAGATTVAAGASVSYTITPNANYHITDVKVDGASIGQVSSYTFQAVDASHTIQAVFAVDTFTVTATAGTGGTISPAGATTAAAGASVSYSITPDANHHIVKVIVDGNSVGQISTYTFESIDASHSIAAVFEVDTFTITATAGTGGAISPEGVASVAYGASVSYTITPDANYHISDVKVDGASVGPVAAYTFEDITAAHTIQAVFEIDTLSITAIPGNGGTISPAGVTNVTYGSSVDFTVVPDANYHIAEVMVDGVSVGQVDTYTFGNITVSHTIEAVFEIDTFTVTATAGEGGTISPEGVANVASGASASYTITPMENYHISDVVVDGASVGQVPTYTFQSIDASHTIEAVFEIDTVSIVASTSGNGALTPEGTIEVALGTDQTFTMTPDTGYVIGDVRVDGESIGAVSEYTFSDITADHTLDVDFVEAIPGFALETGSVTAGGDWQQVSFGRTFADPVVVAATRNMDLIGTLVIRINNLTETGFEISAEAGSTAANTVAETTVDYIVMEAGSFILPDGTVVEADAVVTEDVTGAGSHVFTGVFSAAPATGASIITCNNTEAVSATLGKVSSEGFDYQIEGPDMDNDGHLSEMVSFIALGPWQSPLSDAVVAAGITEEMMTFTSEVITYSQPSANGIDTGTSGDDSTTADGDTVGTDTGDGTGTPDDGTVIPEDNTGSVEEGNHPPFRPVATSSMIQVDGVGPVDLTLEAFSDVDAGDYHAETEWQMFQVESNTCILHVAGDNALTVLEVPAIMLEPATRYSWNARFVDNNGNVSEWSETAYFTTGVSDTDTNANGIPDTQEVDLSVDLNRDRVPDAEQEVIKSILVPNVGVIVGLSIEASDTVSAILRMEAIDPSQMNFTTEAYNFQYGMINFKLAVDQPGATAVVRVLFDRPIPKEVNWIKYDPIQDAMIDYSAHAEFSKNRKQVTLVLVDGGFGDDDGVANGIIVDPSGLKLMNGSAWRSVVELPSGRRNR